MSMLPYFLRNMRHLGNQQKMLSKMLAEDLAQISRDPFFQDPFKMLRQTLQEMDSQGIYKNLAADSTAKDDKKLEVQLDVRNFKPEQIEVKTIGNEIVVEGKFENKAQDGWTKSHFERRFWLPEEYPPERVECKLSNGKLTVTAFKAEEKPIEERKIPLMQENTEAIDNK